MSTAFSFSVPTKVGNSMVFPSTFSSAGSATVSSRTVTVRGARDRKGPRRHRGWEYPICRRRLPRTDGGPGLRRGGVRRNHRGGDRRRGLRKEKIVGDGGRAAVQLRVVARIEAVRRL